MSVEFHAEQSPSKELLGEVAAVAPTDPGHTSSFIHAMRVMGLEPWILSLRENDQILFASPAFMRRGRFNRCVEVTLPPIWRSEAVFWEGLMTFCRSAHVSYLKVNGYPSAGMVIPAIKGEFRRYVRSKYVLDLEKPSLWDDVSTNHRRKIKQAQKTGVRVQRDTADESCRKHAYLVRASLERRRNRGEYVSEEETETEDFSVFIKSGAGEIYEAVLNGEVMSSVLVTLARGGAFYQSAGTSPEGMNCGASHFLVYEIARTLRDNGLKLFNLGGANEDLNPGLQRFKAGFGTEKVEVESAEFFLGSKVRKQFVAAAKRLLQ